MIFITFVWLTNVMCKMLFFPNAKINLGLSVVSKRTDGFHDLETVFYPVNVCDVLEIVPSLDVERTRGSYSLTVFGDDIECVPEKNLVVRAYLLLHSLYDLPPVDIYLWKLIPSQAGLGGGSSDAAFALRALNLIAGLGLSVTELEGLAGGLGADCPFFIQNRPVFATGTGNLFEDVALCLKGYRICIVKPDVNVSTKVAFQGIVPCVPSCSVKELILRPIEAWRGVLVNDFEKGVFERYPLLYDIKEMLYAHGALYASMSGSGSAIFGIYPSGMELPDFSELGYYTWHGVLS